MEGWLPDPVDYCVEDVGERQVVTGSQHWWLLPDVGGAVDFREGEELCLLIFTFCLQCQSRR